MLKGNREFIMIDEQKVTYEEIGSCEEIEKWSKGFKKS